MLLKNIPKSLDYRKPMQVKQIVVHRNQNSFPRCPKCKLTMEREYQAYCDRCGQCLSWDDFENAEIIGTLY